MTHPEKVQTKLDEGEAAGDCEDVHMWIGCAAPEGSSAYLCTVGYTGGAHAVCAIYHESTWWLFDYRLYSETNPNDIPSRIAKKYGKTPVPSWWVWEKIENNELQQPKICKGLI